MTDPVCLVPARGESDGLTRRNRKQLAGKPVLAHTVETAHECERFAEVYVTTESAAIADIAREYGARVIDRPDRLADGDVLLHEVVDHALGALDRPVTDDTPVVVLQSNVPFRRVADIDRALEAFRAGDGEAVISVVADSHFYWRAEGDRLTPEFDARDTRSDLEPFYRETGAINVTTPALVAAGTRVGERPRFVVTDRLSAHAIEGVFDLWLAERIAAGPRVVFRVDGGGETGMGHVSRCLTLADALDDRFRCSITFVTDEAHPAGRDAIEAAGHRVETPGTLATVRGLDPDIVFLDVLDTDERAVSALHETAAAVINLEDLAGGLEAADFVVNALYEDVDGTPTHRAGAEYFVLREEFRDRQGTVPDRAERVLLTFGGSDPDDCSARAAVALGATALECRLVLGPDYDGTVTAASAPANVTVLRAVDEMGELAAWADLAVTSGGRTAYELAATGTPTVVLAQNDREHDRMATLGDRGVVSYLGRASDVPPETLRTAVTDLAADRERRRALAERGGSFIDGEGTRRIADLVFEALVG